MFRRHPATLGTVAVVFAVLLTGAGHAGGCTLDIGEAGLGGIRAETPFDRDAIARAVPGCGVEPAAEASEGEPVDALIIKDGATPMAVVFPDWAGGIFSVVAENPAVRNRLGVPVGASFAGTYDGRPAPVCVPGLEETSGRALCPAMPGARLLYLLEGTTSAPDDVLPPPADLASWTLVGFLWRPVPFEDPRWVDVAGFDPGEGPAFAARVRDSVDDPAGTARLVRYPVPLRVGTSTIVLTDEAAFMTEYARRLTPAFVSAVRREPAEAVRLDAEGAVLAGGRIRIAPVCASELCDVHLVGIVALSMF